jgi:hypothetical protein
MRYEPLVLRLNIASVKQPLMIIMVCWWNENWQGKTMRSESLHRCNSVHYKYHADYPRIKPGCPRREVSHYCLSKGSRDSSVGIATDYGLDDRGVGVQVSVESRIFSSPRRPPSYPMSNGDPFTGVKQKGCEADHSPPASVEVKKIRMYTSTPPYAFMA